MTESSTRKNAAIEFLQLVASGKVRDGFDRFVGPGFRHHNPYFAGDPDSLKAAMEAAAAENPLTTLEVQRTLQDGDLVAVHSKLRHEPNDRGLATVHICRFEGERIVEMWDLWLAPPENSPNQNGMF